MHAGDSFIAFWDHYFPFLNYVYPYIATIAIYSVLLYLVVEVLFFLIIHFGVYPALKPHVKPPAYDSDPLELFKKIVHVADGLDCYSAVKFFEGFFCGASIDTIKADNYRSFLAWVMFALPLSSLNDEQHVKINLGLDFIREKLNIAPAEGHNVEVKHVCMTCSDMQYIHRPLLIYLLTGLMNVISDITLLCMGFQKCRLLNVSYWIRPSASEYTSQDPMLFFHGITTGWIMYLSLVARLGAERTIILMDMDAIKVNSLVFNMPSREEYASVVKSVLDKHHVSQVSVVGHSFGSITAGWFLKCYPERVSHITLLDPVSLLLSLPDVAYNFLYRRPKTTVEWYIYLGASQEITVSYALRRNFWWYKNLLWLEDVPANIGVLVGLAGGDEVGNAAAMKEYAEACHAMRQASMLNAAPISSVYVEGYSHAQMTCCGDTHFKLLEKLYVHEKKAA